MTILAHYKTEYFDEPVEVLDTWDTPKGKYASVKAITGKPFIGGDKWPVHTEYTTTPITNLLDIHQDQPAASTQKSLIDLALEQARAQWHNGQTVWIWKGNHAGAYLKNLGGQVKLCLTDRQPSCLIFILTMNGWEMNNKVQTDYRCWLEAVQL